MHDIREGQFHKLQILYMLYSVALSQVLVDVDLKLEIAISSPKPNHCQANSNGIEFPTANVGLNYKSRKICTNNIHHTEYLPISVMATAV